MFHLFSHFFQKFPRRAGPTSAKPLNSENSPQYNPPSPSLNSSSSSRSTSTRNFSEEKSVKTSKESRKIRRKIKTKERFKKIPPSRLVKSRVSFTIKGSVVPRRRNPENIARLAEPRFLRTLFKRLPVPHFTQTP